MRVYEFNFLERLSHRNHDLCVRATSIVLFSTCFGSGDGGDNKKNKLKHALQFKQMRACIKLRYFVKLFLSKVFSCTSLEVSGFVQASWGTKSFAKLKYRQSSVKFCARNMSLLWATG